MAAPTEATDRSAQALHKGRAASVAQLRPPCMSVAGGGWKACSVCPGPCSVVVYGCSVCPVNIEKKKNYLFLLKSGTHGTPIKCNGTRPGTHGTQTLWQKGPETVPWLRCACKEQPSPKTHPPTAAAHTHTRTASGSMAAVDAPPKPGGHLAAHSPVRPLSLSLSTSRCPAVVSGSRSLTTAAPTDAR